MPYFIYIIYSEKNSKYYIGCCGDLEVRLAQHNGGRNISTKSGIPWKLMYTETFDSFTEARRREAEIKKKKSRKYLEWLISEVR